MFLRVLGERLQRARAGHLQHEVQRRRRLDLRRLRRDERFQGLKTAVVETVYLVVV